MRAFEERRWGKGRGDVRGAGTERAEGARGGHRAWRRWARRGRPSTVSRSHFRQPHSLKATGRPASARRRPPAQMHAMPREGAQAAEQNRTAQHHFSRRARRLPAEAGARRRGGGGARTSALAARMKSFIPERMYIRLARFCQKRKRSGQTPPCKSKPSKSIASSPKNWVTACGSGRVMRLSEMSVLVSFFDSATCAAARQYGLLGSLPPSAPAFFGRGL